MENGNKPIYPLQDAGFPSNESVVEEGTMHGLTKREYFTAMAMQGYCGGEFTGQSGMPVESIAKWAVEMADALLGALEKK